VAACIYACYDSERSTPRPSVQNVQSHRAFWLCLLLQGYPPFGMSPMVSGFENRFRKSACGRDRNRLDKDVDVTYVHKLASKHSIRML